MRRKSQNYEVRKKNANKPHRIVLVGTYRKGQLERWQDYYNYPICEDDAIDSEACKSVNELWLFSGCVSQRSFEVVFEGVKTREELVSRYAYPAKGKSHSEKYLLFRLKSELSDFSTAADKVILRVRDFVKRSPRVAKQLKSYLESESRDSAEMSKLVPSVIARTPASVMSVHEGALQLDFLSILEGYDPRSYAVPKRDNEIRFIDLFAGIGGIRKGFEQACSGAGLDPVCVFTSEIKPHAIKVLKQNHPDEIVHGDITGVVEHDIPDFDVLLGGFPCQAFSSAGRRMGFEDTRGTLFFDVARILKAKRPKGFVLENVEGLVNHDRRNPSDPYGNTLKVILETLEGLGYKVSWKVLNAADFGVPQDRKRIYLTGTRERAPDLEAFEKKSATVGAILKKGLKCSGSEFVRKLTFHYPLKELAGKSIKDKRGGANNIHSWDFGLKGEVTVEQRKLLNMLLRERRKHQWAEVYGIDWMDGMPLTLEMIRTFFDSPDLESMLEDLVEKRYVVKEHPKRKVKQGKVYVREQDPALPMGYNIVAGKMSYEISKILSPKEVAPTLVAMDMQHLYVIDGNGLRNLDLTEGLRLFGYPDDFKFDIDRESGYDLLGNTVVVPVIKAVSDRLLDVIAGEGQAWQKHI